MSREIHNWEREKQHPGIHNPPESLYINFENILIYADGLLEPPQVIIYRVRRAETSRKVRKWLDKNEITYRSNGERHIEVSKVPKKGMNREQLRWYEENKIPYKDGNFIVKTAYYSGENELSKWEDLIQPLTHVFDLKAEKRKKLFSIYRETMIAKLEEAIEAIDRAINEIWNDKIRLLQQWQFLTTSKERYAQALKEFKYKHERTGKYKLIYGLLRPLIERFNEQDFSQYRQIRLLVDLFEIFNFDDFDRKDDPIQSAENIVKEIRKAISPP